MVTAAKSGHDDVRKLAASANPGFFTDQFGVIDAAQGEGDGTGTMPFRLWPAQTRAIGDIATNRLVVVLKARQLGISWLCCSYALWLCLFRPGKLVLLFSKGQAEANELLRRIRALYSRLPPWLIEALPRLTRENTGTIEWANGSRVLSLPATQSAGRSFTASLVVMDEAAHMAYAARLYAAMKPTIDAGGQLIIVSTANGLGGLFHHLWTRAVAGANSFRPIFLPWRARPGRDAAWYAAKVAESDDPATISQEYPASSIEAFLSSGRSRFPSEWVAAQSPNTRASLPPRDWPGPLRALPMDGLAVYGTPYHLARMIIGADVAEGLESGDFSAAVCIDSASGEEFASLRGRWEPDEYARRLFAMAEAFRATVVVERNNHGHAVLSKLRGLNAERLAGAGTEAYGPRPFQAKVADGPDRRPGWITTAVTKPQAIDRLAVLLRDGGVVVRTAATLDEMQVYATGTAGRTGAPDGYNDDLVMAWAVAVGWLALCGQTGEVRRIANPLAGYRG